MDRETFAAKAAAVERHLQRVAHVYENLDLAVVADAAREGPADLRAFLSHAAAWFP